MKSRPKVLHIVYNLIRGGTEGQCAQVAMAAAEQGHEHRIAVFVREGSYLDRVQSTCGEVHEVPICRVVSVGTAYHVLKLARYIKREHFDVVHCWDADAIIFGGIAARIAGVPFISSRRDLGEIYTGRKLWLMRKGDSGARRIVVNAAAIRDQLVRDGYHQDQLVLIPNLFDAASFDSAAERPFSEEAALPSGRLIVMVARLDPEKDTGSLIRAFGLIAEQYPDAQLVIAGDGPERNAMKNLARSSASESRISFLGEIDDVPALLNRCVIGVLVPSANEGFSNAILEYLAACLPVVATECGGNREVLEDGKHGILVPKRDPKAIASALTQLLRNPDQASEMGRSGRQMVESVHDPRVVVSAFLKLYAEVSEGT